MTSIFTKIINREVPAEIVWEDDDLIAFMDQFPFKKGHLLLISKIEVDKLYELPEDIYSKLFVRAKEICLKLEKAYTENHLDMEIKRIGLVVEGFGVPHAHLHFLPISKAREISQVHSHVPAENEIKEMGDFYRSVLK
jgi:histidine triad (HIT) family protein